MITGPVNTIIIKRENNECCPTFYPKKWSEKSFNWDRKKFIKATVPTFFHIPLAPMIGNRITKLMKLAEEAQKLEADKENTLVLFTDPNAFMSEIFLGVTDTVPKAKNTTLSGTFVSKVFDGAYHEVPKFIKQINRYLKNLNETAKRYFVHYAYCPKCAREAGHNYMVLFAEITD